MTRLGCAALLVLTAAGPLAAQEPKLRRTLEGHASGAWSVAFSPDGRTLASASRDGTVKLWDLNPGGTK